MLGWLLKNYTTVEVEFVAAERIDAYASLPREATEAMERAGETEKRQGASGCGERGGVKYGARDAAAGGGGMSGDDDTRAVVVVTASHSTEHPMERPEEEGGGGVPGSKQNRSSHQPSSSEWVSNWLSVRGVAVRLEGLRLSYGVGEPDVLHRINMSFPAGSRVALVGRTGSGKSSIAACLLRLYPYLGRILYDGSESGMAKYAASRTGGGEGGGGEGGGGVGAQYGGSSSAASSASSAPSMASTQSFAPGAFAAVDDEGGGWVEGDEGTEGEEEKAGGEGGEGGEGPPSSLGFLWNLQSHRRNIGYVPQGSGLLGATVREALLGPHMVTGVAANGRGGGKGRPDAAVRWDAAANAALAAVGLGGNGGNESNGCNGNVGNGGTKGNGGATAGGEGGGEEERDDSCEEERTSGGWGGSPSQGPHTMRRGVPSTTHSTAPPPAPSITLDTVLEGGGKNLSAGQRQLICLARALVVPTPLVVCDEGTSSLDSTTEQLVWKALLGLPSTLQKSERRKKKKNGCDERE
jgi:ABC-type cobalamin/Fe3+-siderophores transport system ATPase subunit